VANPDNLGEFEQLILLRRDRPPSSDHIDGAVADRRSLIIVRALGVFVINRHTFIALAMARSVMAKGAATALHPSRLWAE
jgi:hypothetical protein